MWVVAKIKAQELNISVLSISEFKNLIKSLPT